MITNIEENSMITELDINNLPIYWREYLEYDKNKELSDLTKSTFCKIIDMERIKDKPLINSKIIISNMLSEFMKQNNFHKEFKVNFSSLNSSQILGMQLYHILIQDKEIWKIHKLIEKNNLFPYSIYFK